MKNPSTYFQNLTVSDRLLVVRLIIGVGLALGLLSSYKLWLNDRFYPLSPVADFIPVLSPPFDLLLFLSVIILITVIPFYPRKHLFYSFFLLVIYLLFQDQSRLQPWFYQYLFLMGAIAWYEHKPNRGRGISALASCQTILIGIYLWSGLHKLNYTYLFETFEWLMGPALEIFPFLESLSLPFLATISAFIEFGAAIGLAFCTTRKYGAYILIAMHIFILLIVSPLGLNYNNVVWPWNFCFALLVMILFLGPQTEFSYSRIFIPGNLYHSIVLVLFLMIPFLNFFNSWDHFPSASLYSGKKPYAKIHVTDPVKEQFPVKVKSEFSPFNELSIQDWSFTELNVPNYPQSRIYKHIFRQLCDYQKQKFGLVLESYNTADLLTGKRNKNTYFCHEL